MAFLWILANDVVDAIFDEDFGLSDGDESDFEGHGDDIHALLGETVLRRADVMANYVDEEGTSKSAIEEEHDQNDIRLQVNMKAFPILVHWVTHTEKTLASEEPL